MECYEPAGIIEQSVLLTQCSEGDQTEVETCTYELSWKWD